LNQIECHLPGHRVSREQIGIVASCAKRASRAEQEQSKSRLRSSHSIDPVDPAAQCPQNNRRAIIDAGCVQWFAESQGQNNHHPSLPFSSLPSNLRPANWHRVGSDVRRPTSPPPTTAHQLTLPSSFLPCPHNPATHSLDDFSSPADPFAHFALLNTGLFTPSRPLHDVLSIVSPASNHSFFDPSLHNPRPRLRPPYIPSVDRCAQLLISPRLPFILC
jgi:hypothetical protein